MNFASTVTTKVAKPTTIRAKADRMGELAAIMKDADAELKELKAFFKKKAEGLTEKDFAGNLFQVQVRTYNNTGFDKEKALNLLIDYWTKLAKAGVAVPLPTIDDITKTFPVTSVTPRAFSTT